MKSKLLFTVCAVIAFTCYATFSFAQCNNVTSGGTIGSDQAACGSYDPANIINITLPTGGIGTLEYTWQSSPNNSSWSSVAGASLSNYDPATISATTYYRRLSRRSGCSVYNGISNTTTKTVNSPLTTTITNAGLQFCQASTVLLQVQSGATYSYQWYEGSHAIPNSNSYFIETGHDGTYSCTTSNACGSYPSSPATVQTYQIFGFPEFGKIGSTLTTICSGGTVFLYEQLSYQYGFAFFPGYQWYLNGAVIPGATNYTYNATQPGDYTLQITAFDNCQFNFFNYFTNWITLTPSGNSAPLVSISANGPLTFCHGGNVVFTAATSGGNISYQWRMDINPIAGATNATYTATVAGNFNCRVTNPCGAAVSNQLTTTEVPTFASVSPAGPISICTGGSATLTSSNSGGGSYQWKLNGSTIGGATQQTYIATQTGNYTVSITNMCGTFISNSVALTVNNSFTATITPAGPTAFCPGGSVILNAAPTGGGYTYQWKFNGILIPGATLASYTASAAGSYNVNVTNSGCTSVSAPVTVTFTGISVLTLQPGAATGIDATVEGYVSTYNSNFGNDVDLVSLGWNFGSGAAIYRGYIKFDLSQIPTNAIVSQAFLSLYNDPLNLVNGGSHSNQSGSNASVLIQVTGPWTESGITFNNQPSNTTVNQVLIPQSIDGHQDYNLNVTAMTQGMVSSPATNYGMMMHLQNENYYYGLFFASSDNADASKRPKLIVQYYVPVTASINAGGVTTFCSGGSVQLNANTGPGLTYQWKRDGNNINGATMSSYVASISGNYTCTETSDCNITSVSNTITVTVMSTPTATITAGGPTSFCIGSSVLLSANTGVGLSYQWSVDGNNIALATASTYTATTAGNYACSVSNVCGATTSNVISVTVSAPPLTPGAISGSSTVCLNSFANQYSISTVSGATSYAWTVPSGATISQGQGTTTIFVDFGASVANGSICVAAVNACNNSNNSCLAITTSSVPQILNAITGSASACANTTNNVYSISGVTGATSFTWTLPTGASFVSGQGTSSITVSFGANGATGNICVYAGNACGTNSTCKQVTAVTGTTTPASISGTTTPCANSNGVAYSCPAVTGASSYVWTVPSGGTIASGQGTTNITVNFNSSFTSGIIGVSSVNCAGTSAARTLQVYGTPVMPGTITGQTTACGGTTNVQYSIAAVAGATSYSWTAPSNATITNGQGTTTIRLNFGNGFSSGTLSVRAVNSCGNSAARTLAITSVPATPGAISGPATFCANSNVNYSIAAVAGATTYNWDIPTGASITAGQGTTAITVHHGTHSGKIKVRAGNSCGYSAYQILNVTKTCRESGEPIADESLFDISVFPNPSSNQFTISIKGAPGEKYNFILRDLTGRVVEMRENNLSDQQLQFGSGLLDGIYIAEIIIGDQRQWIRIIKQE